MIWLFLLVLIICVYYQKRFFLLAIIFVSFATYTMNPWLIAASIIFAATGLIHPLRRIISYPIYLTVKKLRLIPKISVTEQEALNAGNTWIEKHFFTGKIDFATICKLETSKLSPAEEFFLNNQVDTLCSMVNDWQVQQSRDLPDAAWQYIKKEKFWGMIVPPSYGGLGFSALAQSKVIAKLASRSPVLAISVMVPNSLGPAELLKLYGTQQQKDYYLPKLATGEEIPCFALTELNAGSDASSIEASGILFKQQDKLYIKLNFSKRWITLSGIATIIGLAFKLYDPNNILQKGENVGISLLLLPRHTPGIDLTQRHDPMGIPFYNCPIVGENVIVEATNLIGGLERAGDGWRMLMECLATGRAISLPGMSLGGAKLVANVIGKHSAIRYQFGLPLGKFDGLHPHLARIAGINYLMEKVRDFTSIGLSQGTKPSVVSAIMKYHYTEFLRQLGNDSLDIMGGAGISKGPRNLLNSIYMSIPIGITVEGANILTRCLIIFGQGVMRCHPYAYNILHACVENNVTKFDKNLWSQVYHMQTNFLRSFVYSITRGPMFTCKSQRKISWATAIFAHLTNVVLLKYGANLKRQENINARLGDVLSNLYFAVAIMHSAKNNNSKTEQVYIQWCMCFLFTNIQQALIDLLHNIRGFNAVIYKILLRINPISVGIPDKLNSQLAFLLQDAPECAKLVAGSYTPTDMQEQLVKLEKAVAALTETTHLRQKIKIALQEGKIKANSLNKILIDESIHKILTEEEIQQLQQAERVRCDALEVDSFTQTDFLNNR